MEEKTFSPPKKRKKKKSFCKIKNKPFYFWLGTFSRKHQFFGIHWRIRSCCWTLFLRCLLCLRRSGVGCLNMPALQKKILLLFLLSMIYWKTPIVTNIQLWQNLRKSNRNKTNKTQILTKLKKNLSWDKTQKLNLDQTQKLKLWQNSRT